MYWARGDAFLDLSLPLLPPPALRNSGFCPAPAPTARDGDLCGGICGRAGARDLRLELHGEVGRRGEDVARKHVPVGLRPTQQQVLRWVFGERE